MKTKVAEDGLPFDYTDSNGISWWMEACGHRQSGSRQSTYGLCPNCEFIAKCGISIKIPYPELLPPKLEGSV
jgi:hypothetical protein